MSKYIFIKIKDEPNYDPNQLEYGYAPKEENHKKHNFSLNEEQEDALRHVIMKEGINYNDIINSDIYKTYSKEQKNLIYKWFNHPSNYKGERKELLYYYSKALYEAIPNINNENQSFKYGVFLVKKSETIIPFTMYTAYSKKGILLIDIYVSIKGERDDLDYIINAKNNADIFSYEDKDNYKKQFFINNAYNPHLDWIVKTYKGLFPKSIEKILNDFKTLKDLIDYEGNFPNCNEEESNEIRKSIKKYIENYGKNLAEYFKDKIKNW